jgi:hypothetical protein
MVGSLWSSVSRRESASNHCGLRGKIFHPADCCGPVRRTRLGDLAHAVGKWLLLRGDVPTPVRCLALESDHLWVEAAPGLEQAAYPEEILKIVGDSPPDAADLAAYQLNINKVLERARRMGIPPPITVRRYCLTADAG